MKISKYSEGRNVFIHINGVIFQPTKSNKKCMNCKHGVEGVHIIDCIRHNCICGKDYHCKYFKRK